MKLTDNEDSQKSYFDERKRQTNEIMREIQKNKNARKPKKRQTRKESNKKAYIKRKEDIKITVQFRQKWKEERREYWRRREEWVALYTKCTCINEFFNGSEQHHISKFITVFIPKELHRSMYHSLRSGKNMLRINDLVFEWLELHVI